MSTAAVRRLAVAAGVAAAFGVVATLNCGGYRYGVGDQAFYIPAILLDLDPAAFPRDRALIEAQDPLMVFDEALAGVVGATGVSLPVLFGMLYVAGVVLLAWASTRFARALGFGPAATVTFLALLTLKHRIAQTGVNTLEGYLHPRMLAFAVGVLAVSLVVRERPFTGLLFTGAAMLVHPTTGFWFVLLVGVVLMTTTAPAHRRHATAIGAVAAAMGAVIGFALFADRLVVMDDEWVRALEQKDYIFPHLWGAGPWVANVGTVAAVVAVYRFRATIGAAAARERGVVWGVATLIALFAATLPFVAARVALAVQMQTSRVFWLADFVAVAYIAWLVTESPSVRRLAQRDNRLQWIVAGTLFVAALSRGLYVTYIEHTDRGAFALDVPDDEWTDVMRWVKAQTHGTHVLADPGHAWRYGTSVRIAARRDVVVEEQKDSAIAMYSRGIAVRVLERMEAIGTFSEMTVERARTLAARYDVDFLVTEHPLPIDTVYRNARFVVHDLRHVNRIAHHHVKSRHAR